MHQAGRWEGEIRRALATGAEITVLARWDLRRDHAGRPRDIVETGRDIAAAKKSEQTREPSWPEESTLALPRASWRA